MRRLLAISPALALAAVSAVGLTGCHPSGWEFCNSTKPGQFWTVTVVTNFGGNWWNCNAVAPSGGQKACWIGLNDGEHQTTYYTCTTADLLEAGEPF